MQMEQFWGQFVGGATGTLSIGGSNVQWPVYSQTTDESLRLDTPVLEVQQNRLETLCDMWDKIGYY